MILRSWRYFLKVADTENLTRAATQLHMTQPALSRHLKQLEEEMGVRLLKRHGRGVRLTEAGTLFVEQAGDILAQADALADTLQAREVSPVGQLSIGMPLSWTNLVTIPLLIAYRAKYPSVKLRLIEGTTDALRTALKQREIQLAVITMIDPDPEIEVRPFISDGAFLIGSPNSKVIRKGTVNFNALAGEPLVMLTHTPNVHREFERALSRARLNSDIVLEVNTMSLFNFVEQGLGYSAVPACAVASFERLQKLEYGLIPGFRSDWAMATLRAYPKTAALRTFTEMLTEFVGDLVDSGKWPSAELINQKTKAPSKKKGL